MVHGGDLLFRSRVGPGLVLRALEPLLEIADSTPVVLVLGNHERSSLPFPLFGVHEGLFLVDRPRRIDLDVGGTRVQVVAMPHDRRGARARVPRALEDLDWQGTFPDVRLLCLHEAVEGARVGPADFTFRDRPDTVRARDLPMGFAAVLAGHVHRHQVLRRDLRGRELAAPVVFAGSTERTSTAEIAEPKGFVLLELEPGPDGGRLASLEFVELPTRPMARLDLDGPTAEADRLLLRETVATLPRNAVLVVRCGGPSRPSLSTREIREAAPTTMTVEIRVRPSGSAEEL